MAIAGRIPFGRKILGAFGAAVKAEEVGKLAVKVGAPVAQRIGKAATSFEGVKAAWDRLDDTAKQALAEALERLPGAEEGMTDAERTAALQRIAEDLGIELPVVDGASLDQLHKSLERIGAQTQDAFNALAKMPTAAAVERPRGEGGQEGVDRMAAALGVPADLLDLGADPKK